MKRKSKAILACLTLCVCAGLTGCGKETVDVSAEADILVSGYDGYGIATFSKGNWLTNTEKTYGQEMSFMELAALEEALYDAVEYSISPSENISNGDEVVLTIDVDNSALESYNFKLAGGEKKITVSGLEEVKAFDPFENVVVNFGGMSPNGSVSVNTSDSNVDINLIYTPDKSSGLKNGDEVTVSISSPSGTDVEEYCVSKGKAPTVTEKTFTVEGLASYAQALSDIPDDSLDKIRSQAESEIASGVAGDAVSNFKQESSEFLGYYFLSGKDGFGTSPYNILYCVYKMKYSGSAYEYDKSREGKYRNESEKTTLYDEFYTTCRIDDIVILSDGTCSFDLTSMLLPPKNVSLSDNFANEYGYKNNSFYGSYWRGYCDIDSMFNECVTSKISNYTYENTVKE